jgi:hypothetical protein
MVFAVKEVMVIPMEVIKMIGICYDTMLKYKPFTWIVFITPMIFLGGVFIVIVPCVLAGLVLSSICLTIALGIWFVYCKVVEYIMNTFPNLKSKIITKSKEVFNYVKR